MSKIILQLFNPENEFFKLTKNAKRITHIWLSSLFLPAIFLVISALLTQYVLAPLYFGDPKMASSSARAAFGLYSLFTLIIICVALWVKFYEKRPFYTIGFTKKNAVKKYLSGFANGIGMNVSIVLILAILGLIKQGSENLTATGLNAIGGVLVFLFAFIIQGASEEILTRGWMFQVIGARYKPWIGVIITSIAFSLMHSGNDGAGIFAGINIFLVAILLSLFVMKDGSLWGACGWHSAWNWTLGNVFGLSVSGNSEKVSIFNLTTTGNELITGGEFGVEGSLILTLLLTSMIVFIALYLIRKDKKLKRESVAFAN